MVHSNTIQLTSSPYPGLRSFQAGEADIFFGREEQTDQLLEKLASNKFLAVVGPSGCGKSSLVKAGMIASLKAGFLSSAGSSWKIAEIRPGRTPFSRLAEALLPLLGEEETDSRSVGFLRATLKRGPLGLIEAYNEASLPKNTNLLILVDQFEEIFRFRRENNEDEADAFISLLLATALKKEVPIYVVITMRSDFLGDCSLFSGLPEALNKCQFLAPKLTRDQCQDAITKPARVFDFEIDPVLTNQLLNEIGSDNDQLPLLQHALMRMWQCKTIQNQYKLVETRIDLLNDNNIITAEDYTTAGGLSNALNDHLNEVFNELSPIQQKIAEGIFRYLTDVSKQRAIRRPAPIKEIAATIGVQSEEVIQVVEVFRKTNRSFLMPSPEAKLDEDTYIDITHESIMRQWRLLKGWMQKEQDSSRNFKWLSHSVTDKRHALQGIDLKTALEWVDTQKPNETWANRYYGNFREVLEYIALSKRKNKIRNFFNGLFIAVLLGCMLLTIVFFYQKNKSVDTAVSLVSSKFYTSLGLDSINRNSAFDYLVHNAGSSNYADALSSVNQAALSAELVDTDPEKAFTLLQSAGELSKNETTDKVILSVLNKNIFPCQKVYTSYYSFYEYFPSGIIVSNQSNELMLFSSSDMMRGYFEKDSLRIDTSFYKGFNPSLEVINTFKYKSEGKCVIDNKTITYVDKNIYRWNNKNISKILTLVEPSDTAVCSLSNDGSLFAASNSEGNVRVWKIGEKRLNTSPDFSFNADSKGKGISVLTISPSNKEIYLGYYDGSVNMIDLTRKTVVTVVEKISGIEAQINDNAVSSISCSNDTTRIVTCGVNGIVLWERQPDQWISQGINVDNKKLTLAKLSPGGRRILLSTMDNELYLYDLEKKDADKIKKLPGSPLIGTFLNESFIITSDYYGIQKLWKVYPEFNSLKEALATIKAPAKDIISKLEDGSIKFDKFINTENEHDLKIAAQYFIRNFKSSDIKEEIKSDRLMKARMIYRKLLSMDSVQNREGYIVSIMDINNYFIDNEKRKPKDSINYSVLVENYKETIRLEDALINSKLSPQSSYLVLKPYRASAWGLLSGYELYNRNYKDAIRAALIGLEQSPEKKWINRNLALGYLLNGEYERAKLIYIKLKNKTIEENSDGYKTFKEAFLNDLQEAETAGLVSDKIKKNDVKDIREILTQVQQTRKDFKFIISSQNQGG